MARITELLLANEAARLPRIALIAAGLVVLGLAIWIGGMIDGGSSTSSPAAAATGAARAAGGPELLDTSAALDLGLKLLFVAGLIYGVVWVIKRMSSRRGLAGDGAGLELVDTLSIGSQRYLHVVRAGRKTVLIGATASQITALGELEEEDPLDPAGWDAHPGALRGHSVRTLEALAAGDPPPRPPRPVNWDSLARAMEHDR